MIKFPARADRWMKVEPTDAIARQVDDLLQLWEDQILRGRFQICVRDGKLPPAPEEISAVRETATEPKNELLSPRTVDMLLQPCED